MEEGQSMGDGAQGSSLPSPVCHIPRSQGVGLKVLMCFALSCFANVAFFYKLKVCGSPALSKCCCHFYILKFSLLTYILAVVGLCCRAQAFSSCGALASCCSGFFLQSTGSGAQASVAAALRISSCSLQAQ